MNKTHANGTDTKYTERNTGIIFFHKITTNETTAGYSDSFKYSTNQTLQNPKKNLNPLENSDFHQQNKKKMVHSVIYTCNVAAVPLGATAFAYITIVA